MKPEKSSEKRRIKRLRKAYFHGVDAQDWHAWANLFTEDCTFDSAPPGSSPLHLGNRAEFLSYVQNYLAGGRTIHVGELRSLTFTDQDHAVGLWSMNDCVLLANNRSRIGAGYYDDTYRRENGEWRFSSVRLTYLWDSRLLLPTTSPG
jgi:SnoaL-like domain